MSCFNHDFYLFQSKEKTLKQLRLPKRPQDGDKNEPSAKRGKNSTCSSDAQKLIIQFLNSLKRETLPEEILEAIEVLKNCDNESNKTKPCNLSEVINVEWNVNIKPVGKQDVCLGTEHLEDDYIEIEVQKYEDKKTKMPSKQTQTDKEGSKRNKEVTDRVLSDDFKCRSFTGMFRYVTFYYT